VYRAIDGAIADIRAGLGGPIPRHLRDASYRGAARLGHGKGYRYAHDDPRGVVGQRYAPEDIATRRYYQPTDHGAEREVVDRLRWLRTVLQQGDEGRGEPREGGSGEPREGGSGEPREGGRGGSGDKPGGVDAEDPHRG